MASWRGAVRSVHTRVHHAAYDQVATAVPLVHLYLLPCLLVGTLTRRDRGAPRVRADAACRRGVGQRSPSHHRIASVSSGDAREQLRIVNVSQAPEPPLALGWSAASESTSRSSAAALPPTSGSAAGPTWRPGRPFELTMATAPLGCLPKTAYGLR